MFQGFVCCWTQWYNSLYPARTVYCLALVKCGSRDTGTLSDARFVRRETRCLGAAAFAVVKVFCSVVRAVTDPGSGLFTQMTPRQNFDATAETDWTVF